MEKVQAMGMVKKLTKIGSSSALIIDKALMEILGISQNSDVEIHTDGRSLIVTPVLPDKAYENLPNAVKKAFEKSLHEDHEVYKKLAE